MAASETNEVFLKNTLFYKLRILNYIVFVLEENGMISGVIDYSTVFWLIFDEKTGKIKYIQV